MIEGFKLRDLALRADERGDLGEIYRADWGELDRPSQWNIVHSRPNTLRGVHVHRHHDDYLFLAGGVMLLGLHDLRAASTTQGCSALVRLDAAAPQTALIPRGVMHGFFFPGEATLIYGLTACWTPADDLGCRWDDAALGIDWPARNPLLSPRDAQAPSLAELKQQLSEKGGPL